MSGPWGLYHNFAASVKDTDFAEQHNSGTIVEIKIA